MNNMIDISKKSWHYRFLAFADYADEVGYVVEYESSCAYLGLMARGVLWVIALMHLWFMVGFGVVYDAIVFSIYFNECGWNLGAFRAAFIALPFLLGFIAILQMVVLVCTAGFACCLLIPALRATYPSVLSIKIKETSTFKLFAAWRAKMCVRINLTD